MKMLKLSFQEECGMKVVIRVAAKDRARAWGVLVRHSAGTAMPHGIFIISEDAVRALGSAGIEFDEISRA
jgi:hypothetical protein